MSAEEIADCKAWMDTGETGRYLASLTAKEIEAVDDREMALWLLGEAKKSAMAAWNAMAELEMKVNKLFDSKHRVAGLDEFAKWCQEHGFSGRVFQAREFVDQVSMRLPR